ncbi:glycosyltransferase family 4 protein [uncultured Thiohalocapsa sp.]|uniref:glycosyltransferase family 4 protein n=1 Tax=uncultured Thiohalocapsa sp. TaxID=768990 RepID=UPI0025E54431|nr:glycosyltransferase family 4 protein [uncultured Thiohalocapsa sp.]
MKVLVLANVTPFMYGGADYHIEGLTAALHLQGHETLCLRLPFNYHRHGDIASLMEFCDGLDLSQPNGVRIDTLISLQFPTYGVLHDDHCVWIMHQHRGAYDLYQSADASPEDTALRMRIQDFDNRALERVQRRFANSARVAERLSQYNGIAAEPLYHPPPAPERFYTARPQGYLFFPSRLETLKRQDLLIEAARYLRTPVVFLLAGDGGQRPRCEQLIAKLGVGDRVRLLGRVNEAEKRTFYANSLGVFYGPRDEDYGYVTLEAMLSAKPVITCTDSGGPLEFVRHNETGLVVPPDAQAIAAAADHLYRDQACARHLGLAGRRRYDTLGISWERVVHRLLGRAQPT